MGKCCNVDWGKEVLRCLHCGRTIKVKIPLKTSRDLEMKQYFDGK
mgnify:CR=1 FL=1